MSEVMEQFSFSLFGYYLDSSFFLALLHLCLQGLSSFLVAVHGAFSTCSTWDFPQACGLNCPETWGFCSMTRIKPTSLALEGRFLTIGPPMKAKEASHALCDSILGSTQNK